MLLFDFTPDLGATGNSSHMDNGNIRLEIKFSKPLPDSITCLLYLEFDNSFLGKFSSDCWWTLQILCTLRDEKVFLGVFPSDILQNWITRSGTVIINAGTHTEKSSHWLAIHFETRCLLFRLIRYLLHHSRPTSILDTQLHRLGLQQATTERSDQQYVRPILLPIRPVHGKRLHP